MKNWFLTMAIGMVIKILTKQAPEMIVGFWNSIREKAKKYVDGTSNTADDWIYAAIFISGEDSMRLADMILDWGEVYVLGSASKLDDAIFLPIFKMIRDTANIPEFEDIVVVPEETNIVNG